MKLENKVESMARRTVRGKVEKMVEAVAMMKVGEKLGVVAAAGAVKQEKKAEEMTEVVGVWKTVDGQRVQKELKS